MRSIGVSIIAVIILVVAGQAGAQTSPATPPSAENLAAARELVAVSRATDRFQFIVPKIFQSLKAAIVQNDPEMEKQYDAMMPVLEQKAQQRMGELIDAVAVIYANNFTADELHDMTAFLGRQPAKNT